jgi:hypothetical protein
MSAASAGTVTVQFATGGGNATAGSDYVSASGTLTFSAGQTSKTISIVINGDRTRGEGNETLLVTLTNASGATLADGQAIVTILDDDGAARAGAIGAHDVTAALDAVTARAVLAAAALAWGSALDGVDLSTISVEITDLPFDLLAQTSPDGTTILIDLDAAGWGWSTDATAPVGRTSIDLFTVLAHELGHVLGIDHGASELMDEVIQPGRRELPSLALDAPQTEAVRTTLIATMRPIGTVTSGVPQLDLVVTRLIAEVPRVPRVVGVEANAALSPLALERPAAAVSALVRGAGRGATPMAPTTMWALLIGLGVALAALRRCRWLLIPRR